jgi:cysteinyl-tRNA synthetase
MVMRFHGRKRPVRVARCCRFLGFYIILGAILSLPAVATALPDLAAVRSFAYQLQNIDLAELKESPYELIVIDYSRDGSQRQAFRPNEIAELKAAGKKVLAYLSIGEAENYRFYFRSRWIASRSGAPCDVARTARAPLWLDESNVEWCGNYKVKHWDPAWQKIIYGVRAGGRKSYLDRIIDAGFDGVYLDIIDGYEYWRSKPKPARRVTAARDMAKFVIALGRYARKVRGRTSFIVVPQNGAGIIRKVAPTVRNEYLKTIQAIGAEDTFYFGPAAEDNPLAPQPVISILDFYVQAGKKVLALDYLLDGDKRDDFFRRACERGYIPQTSNRPLDTLVHHQFLNCSCILTVGGQVC